MAGPELLLIKTQKVDDYFKAREYLKNENIEFYTYQVPSLRKLNFVVRDLPASTPVDVIKLTLDHSVNKEKLTSLTHLIGQKIRITDYVKPKLLVQCFRCQQLGHTKNYYNFQLNCVKCGGPHLSRECKKIPTDPPNCYLCKEKHTANYKGCKIFLKAKEAIKDRNKLRNPNINSPSQFPSLTNNNHNTPPPPTSWPKPNPTNDPNPNSMQDDLQTWFLAILNQVNLPPPTITEKKTIILALFIMAGANLNKLNVITWNYNGISNKTPLLTHFLSTNDIHLLALQETKLSPSKSLFLPNFKIIRKERDKAGGGVAIAIRKNIPFHIISLPIFKSLEIIGISLKTNNSPYIVYSTYIPWPVKNCIKRTSSFHPKSK
ncbi:hypothetical protein J437_LFUL010034 [Ladona fulva]|uniref:Pre-C2HC domain-containing protein n=1 Tax=Ladona fulva TaxID=123851 RepID=A0A8K0K8L8_LADFU|nr:hypothetical protein J437_LFUL010034 [Ladona fulva]